MNLVLSTMQLIGNTRHLDLSIQIESVLGVIGSLEEKEEQQQRISEEEEVAQVRVKEEELEASSNEEVPRVDHERSSEEEEVAQIVVKEEDIESSSNEEVPAGDKVSSRQQNVEHHQSEKRDATPPVQEGRTIEEELNHLSSSANDLVPSKDGTEDDDNGNALVRPIVSTATVARGRKRTSAPTSSSARPVEMPSTDIQGRSNKRAKRHLAAASITTSQTSRALRRSTRRRKCVSRPPKYVDESDCESDDECVLEEKSDDDDDDDDDDMPLIDLLESSLDDDGRGQRSRQETNIAAKPNRGPRAGTKSFDDRFQELMEFKQRFGHCNVCSRSREYSSLGIWCSNLRTAYRIIRKGEAPTRYKLSDDNMQRLENAGFKWSFISTFDERFDELMEFKDKFGHCNMSSRSNDYRYLGIWCSHLRAAYKSIHKGETPNIKLSNENVERLENAGFKWRLKNSTFDERFDELMEFKDEFGHCNVSSISKDYLTLGQWCSSLRQSYRKIQKGETPNNKLSNENIKRLEDAGFKWSLR